MASFICIPLSLAHGVVIRPAVGLSFLRSSLAARILLSGAVSVRLMTIRSAFATWSLKNSPKLRIYIRHLPASTTVTFAPMDVPSTFSTARATSDSLPTPDGSIIILSGLYSSMTFFSAFSKSPTRVQQMQPEFISVISTPASLRKPPSIAISPNSFSMRTSFSPLYASAMSLRISVVLPAPRKPENISILVIMIPPNVFSKFILYHRHSDFTSDHAHFRRRCMENTFSPQLRGVIH